MDPTERAEPLQRSESDRTVHSRAHTLTHADTHTHTHTDRHDGTAEVCGGFVAAVAPWSCSAVFPVSKVHWSRSINALDPVTASTRTAPDDTDMVSQYQSPPNRSIRSELQRVCEELDTAG